MVFAMCSIPGMSFAFPDVCKTPTPVGPIPLPYPNIGISAMAIPSQFSTFFSCMPAHNLATVTPMTNGDNVGVAMGVVSSLVMGPSKAVLGSMKTMVGCVFASRLTSPTTQNGINTVGINLVPSQFRVLLLS